MKITLVRLSVLALAFVGFAASSVISQSQDSTKHVATAQVSMMPVPLCAPSDPTHCGME